MPSAPCRACLLNAAPVCSTRKAFLLNGRRSVRWRAVGRSSAQGRAVSSMQGRSFQCRAVCYNAGPFGWLDQDLLRELSSEWCFFFSPKMPIWEVPCFCPDFPLDKNPTWEYFSFSEFLPKKKPTWRCPPCSRLQVKRWQRGAARGWRDWCGCGCVVWVSDRPVGRRGEEEAYSKVSFFLLKKSV